MKPDTKIYTRNRVCLPKMLRKKNTRKVIKKSFYILAILLITCIVVKTLLTSINPIFEERCKSTAKSLATKISNQQATIAISKYTYDDLINIEKDNEGKIKMIGTNIITVNEIISEIPVKIQEELEKSENNNFNIKFGSFFGNKFFAGMGPNVNIKLQLEGNVETELKSEFVAQGINQTLHRIYLDVKCTVIILTPFETVEEKITNQVLLMEGIIAGEIPQSYYNLEGLEQNEAVEIIN